MLPRRHASSYEEDDQNRSGQRGDHPHREVRCLSKPCGRALGRFDPKRETREDEYYLVTQSGFLVVDLTTWGWIMLLWGVLLVLAGLGLLAGQGWARWFTIVVVTLNVFAQLGFLGNSQYPLWALTALALNVVVLYALTARWNESEAELTSVR